MVLEGDEQVRIVRAGMQGLSLTAQKFPETLGISVALDGVGLLSPEGTIASSGQELQVQQDSAAPDSGDLVVYPPLMQYSSPNCH